MTRPKRFTYLKCLKKKKPIFYLDELSLNFIFFISSIINKVENTIVAHRKRIAKINAVIAELNVPLVMGPSPLQRLPPKKIVNTNPINNTEME
jgi:hypothetical protein